MTVEKISAVTFRVADMKESVRFYRDVLGMELLYGGEGACFSSLRAKDPQSAILNLEQGDPMTRWGRLIFHVEDVDTVWRHFTGLGFHPEAPQDASWGERYFHMPDPDGHELSFAHPVLQSSSSRTNSSGARSSLRRYSCSIRWRTFCPGWGSRKETTLGCGVAVYDRFFT